MKKTTTGNTHTNTTTAKTANTTAAEERRNRLRALIAKQIDELDASGRFDGQTFFPVKWFEKIEGRSMIDVILDHLCVQRGIGVENPTAAQKLHILTDEIEASHGTRSRNKHEAELVSFEIDECLSNFTGIRLDPAEVKHLIKFFYHAGDRGIRKAITRATRSAILWEAEAEMARKPFTPPMPLKPRKGRKA